MMIRLKSIARRILVIVHLLWVYDFLAHIKQKVAIARDRLSRRVRYARIIKRIRAYPPSRRIKVLFLVVNSAKWKAQSLFEAMKSDGRFYPVMALTTDKEELHFNVAKALHKLDTDKCFYEELGNECVEAFDREGMRGIELSKFSPDIIFYQAPGSILEEQGLQNASKYALCCYIPYSIETFEMLWIHRLPYFHELLYLQVAPTEVDANYIKKRMPLWRRSGAIVGLGHTIFDEYIKDEPDAGLSSSFVIYAPHFSFKCDKVDRPIVISTFLETGKPILSYAQKHPEIKWLFKPHPRLRRELEECDVWSKNEIDEYFSAWERIGISCYEGNYIRLFKQSKALITDCSSFLVEYALTGNPIIRLVDENINVRTRPAYKQLFSSYYVVDSKSNMESIFTNIFENEEDNMRQRRIAAVAGLGVGSELSAIKILSYLSSRLFR